MAEFWVQRPMDDPFFPTEAELATAVRAIQCIGHSETDGTPEFDYSPDWLEEIALPEMAVSDWLYIDTDGNPATATNEAFTQAYEPVLS